MTLHDSFHVTYQGNELLGHKLSPNISVNGHQNKLAFNGSRVFRDNRTHQTFITPYAWTVFELSILAGKLLSDSEIEKLQQIHEIGRNQTGANGELATTGKYTFGQLKQKSKEFKQAFPYLDPNAFYRFIINGALGDPPTGGSSHPPPTDKRDIAAYLGNTRYFPIFREFLIHLKTTTPDESQESLLGLPVEFCCTMRHKITYLKKNVIHQKKKAWQITFSKRFIYLISLLIG